MVHSAVRRELLEKLGVQKQALSRRAKKVKDALGPMTTDEAVYVIAHQQGIDLSKHLPIAVLDRVRSLVPRALPAERDVRAARAASVAKKAKQPRSRTYPLVSERLGAAGRNLGSEVYPRLFLLENSIRCLISRRLSKSASNWWDTLVPRAVQENVSRTMKREKRCPYRRPRGSSELSYANFSDLRDIILANGAHFRDVIPDMEWFKVKMDEVYMARNSLAHCVSLSNEDILRITVFFGDWKRSLEAAGLK